MPVLITADLHLSDNPRDSYRHDFMQRLPKLLGDCDALYVLGDLTEAKDFHGSWLVNTVVETFYKLAKHVKVVILKGNHDYTRESRPFYAFLQRIPNVTWINEPLAKDDRLFLPHTSNPAKEWKDIDLQAYNFIFCHQTFDGAKENGRALRGVDRHILPINKRVFSGDVHSPQRIDNITYVGAPYTIDFGDSYTPRVLKLFEKGHFKQAPNAISVGSIPCKGPQKHLLEITSRDNLYHEGDPFEEGAILKVRVKLSSDERERWPQIRQEVIHWAAKNKYALWQIKPVFDTTRSIRAWKQASPESDKETLARYGMIRKVPERTVKTGQWLLEQGS